MTPDSLDPDTFHHELRAAVRDWLAAGRTDDQLYQGARLAAAREWASGRADLSIDEENFLLAGRAVAARVLLRQRREQHGWRRWWVVLSERLRLARPPAVAAAPRRRTRR